MLLFYSLLGALFLFYALLGGSIAFEAFKQRRILKTHTMVVVGHGPKGILSMHECTRCGLSLYMKGNRPAGFEENIPVCSTVSPTYLDDEGNEVPLH